MAVVPNRAPGSPVARWVFRIVGLVLLLVGAYFLVTGVGSFLHEMNSDTVNADDSGPGPILRAGGGGFLVVFGLAALSAGFAGAQAGYVANESAGAVRTTGAAWRGQNAASGGPTTTERVCGGCGAANQQTARFCDACGHALG